jgi:hypothetical protein
MFIGFVCSSLTLAPLGTNTSAASHYTVSDTFFVRLLSARCLAKEIYFATPTFTSMGSAADCARVSCDAATLWVSC